MVSYLQVKHCQNNSWLGNCYNCNVFIIRDVSGGFTKDSGSGEHALLFWCTQPASIHQLSKRETFLRRGKQNHETPTQQHIILLPGGCWKEKVTFRHQLLHHPEDDRSGSQTTSIKLLTTTSEVPDIVLRTRISTHERAMSTRN